MKKKLIALVLCLTVVFAFTACGGGDADNSDSPYVGTWKAADISLIASDRGR